MSNANQAGGQALVQYWVDRLKETEPRGKDNPLRSDDEIIVQLFESLEGYIGRDAIDQRCDRFARGDRSNEVVGFTFLRDAYDKRHFQAELPELRTQVRVRKRWIGEGKSVRYLLRRTRALSALHKVCRTLFSWSLLEGAGEFDHRLIFAREVWRRGDVRKRIVDSVSMVLLLNQKAPGAGEPGRESGDNASELRRAIEYWNSSDDVSWADTNRMLGREPELKNATTAEIKRFADRTGLSLRIKRPGAKKRKQSKKSNE